MASQTSGNFNLQYPEASDPVNVHGDIKVLAEDVRDALSGLDLSVIQVRVKNDSGETLNATTPVYVTGFDTLTLVDKATRTTSPIFGLLKNTVAQNAEGIVVVAGVLSNVNTSGFTAGSTLYVNDSGALTSTRPANGGPAVGIVARSDSNFGVIIVEAKGNGTWGSLRDGLA